MVNQMKLIAFTGLPRAGKDTAANFLIEHREYERRAFATPLKAAAAVLLNREVWEMEGRHGFDREAILPEWGFSTRWFLQRLGTECMRDQIAADFWLKRMKATLRLGNTRYVITDCRFPNEAAFVRANGGAVVEIRRSDTVDNGHISNVGVKADYTIQNDGSIEDLWCEVARFSECS